MAGQSKKLEVEHVLLEKDNLQWYWKSENVCEAQRHRQCEFAMEPPAQLMTARICDKFEVDGTVHDVRK
jgi:hypothetical protein